jgi:hypothetical protein
MESPGVSAGASGKQYTRFTVFVLCLCLVAVILGLVDISTGYHRVLPTFACAGLACILANSVWPNRWWSIVGAPMSIAAIVAFFIK